MTHLEFLAQLPAATKVQLVLKSNRRGLAQLGLHWGALALMSVGIMQGGFGLALLPLQGIVLIMCFTLMHECTHKTPFHSPWLNEGVGRVCGFFLFLPFVWFRYFHFAHHKYTNDPLRDPELLGVKKPKTKREYIWYILGVHIWRGQLATLSANARGRDFAGFIPRSAQRKITNESRIMVFLYILTVLSSPITLEYTLKLWILPIIIGQPFLRLFLLAEHGRCPLVADMFENSRTTLTNSVVRRLSWNMPYHAEHHSLPMVPFHQLPRFHRLIKAHLKTTEPGYSRFHRRYLETLKNN